MDEAFPGSGGPWLAQVTNQHPNTSGVRFPLPSLSPNTCLISLMSQVITSGELICYSTLAAIGLGSTQTGQKSLLQIICKAARTKQTSSSLSPLSTVLGIFSSEHFLKMICKYSVQLRRLVLSQKLLLSLRFVLLENEVCIQGVTAILPRAPALHSHDCFHNHHVQPYGDLGQCLLPSLFLKTVLLCMITGANANLC